MKRKTKPKLTKAALARALHHACAVLDGMVELAEEEGLLDSHDGRMEQWSEGDDMRCQISAWRKLAKGVRK